MLIKAVANKFADGRMGTGIYQMLKGKFNGKTIKIERFGNVREGIKQKHYQIDGENCQKIVNKMKNSDGKFEIIG